MKNDTHLAEQHILEYESRLKHIDALLDKAHTVAAKRPEPELREQLTRIKTERDRLAHAVATIRQSPATKFGETQGEAGPMAVWDIIAQQLEKLVERFGG